MGEFGQYTTALLSSMVRALRGGSQGVGVHKQRAHAGQKGNELADGGAKSVAAGKVGAMQLRAPTLNGAVGAGQWEPHLHIFPRLPPPIRTPLQKRVSLGVRNMG